MESPLHHFHLEPIIPLSVLGVDISINKAVIAMWVGLAIVLALFMLVGSRGTKVVPGKLQSVLEIAMEFIKGMIDEFIGKEEGKKWGYLTTTLNLI